MRISIIITCHNYGRFVGRAIQSSLAQTSLPKEDIEVIVVDDGSTDNSKRVIESYIPEVRAIYHDSQKGLPAAINTGIRASRGPYILRVDADDWLDSHAAFILSYFLDHYKEIGFVWPDYYTYDEYERVTGRISEPQGAGIMFRKQLLVEVGLYDEDQLVHEDKDILLRCIEKYPGYHLRLPLYRYFIHGDNLTNKKDLVRKYGKRLDNKHGEGAWDKGMITNPGIQHPTLHQPEIN